MKALIPIVLASLWLTSTLTADIVTLTDVQGRQIEAEVLSLEGDQVKIRKDGREFEVALATLSAETQDMLKSFKAPPAPVPENAPKPGATLEFAFPDLPKDFHGEPAMLKIKIPDSYDPTKPAPLLIFLPGGKGGNNPNGGGLSKGEFVLAGLPYPDNGRNPNQNNMVGAFDEVWNYWQPMLAKLEETVPNLDPNLRIIGGFSNGAHAIDGLLGESEFSEWFTAFILIDGGGALGDNYRDARDKHFYYAWGEKSPNGNYSDKVQGRARRAGMHVEGGEMTGVGHQFASSEKEKVITWIYETVMPSAGKE